MTRAVSRWLPRNVFRRQRRLLRRSRGARPPSGRGLRLPVVAGSELSEEGPDVLILPAGLLPGIRGVGGVGTNEGAKFHRIPSRAAREVSADMIAGRLRRGLCCAAVGRGPGLGNGHPPAVGQHGIVRPVGGVVGNGFARAGLTVVGVAEIGDGVDRDGANPPSMCYSAKRPLAGGLLGHTRTVTPAGGEDAVRIDAEVLLDLALDGVGEEHVRIIRVGPSAPRGLRAVRTILLPVGGHEDRRVVGERKEMVVAIPIHLVVVAIELVIGDDELVRVGVVVVGRYIEDILARHAADRDRDVVAVVVVAARDGGRLAAAGAHAGSRATGARAAGARPTGATAARSRAARASPAGRFAACATVSGRGTAHAR